MAYEIHADSIAELRMRKSQKWRQFPGDVLPLPVAEMDFPIAEPIKDALRDMINRSDTGYLGPFPEMFEAFANFADDLWSWQVDVGQMRIATDVGVATVEVLRTLINPGDQVVLNSPVYDSMWRWVQEVRAELVDVPLIKEYLEYRLDLEAIEVAYAAGAKVHILCSPHNPVGILYSKSELAAIAELARRYGVIVISDEIHGALTYPGKEFHPFLAVSDAAQEVGIVITSASKAFNLAGLKCAMIITGSEGLKKRIDKMPISVASRASLFGAVAATAAFAESRQWLTGVIESLDKNRHLLADLIADRLPTIGYRVPDFGYLAWIDLGSLGLGDNPSKTLLERGKIAINPGSNYAINHAQFARLNFGTSPELLTEAIYRIANAL